MAVTGALVTYAMENGENVKKNIVGSMFVTVVCYGICLAAARCTDDKLDAPDLLDDLMTFCGRNIRYHIYNLIF